MRRPKGVSCSIRLALLRHTLFIYSKKYLKKLTNGIISFFHRFGSWPVVFFFISFLKFQIWVEKRFHRVWVIRFHKYFLLLFKKQKKKKSSSPTENIQLFFWVVVPLQLVDDVIRILHRLSVCLSVRRMTIERRDDAVPARSPPYVMAVIDLILSNHSSNTHTHIEYL
jgi:hypothetical protein